MQSNGAGYRSVCDVRRAREAFFSVVALLVCNHIPRGLEPPVMSMSADRSMVAYSPAAKTSALAGERSVTGALRPAIPSLTGLRFIAAFAVLIGHAMHWVVPISPDYSVIRLLGEASGL